MHTEMVDIACDPLYHSHMPNREAQPISLYAHTLRALLRPRRLLPVVIVSATLAFTEAIYSLNSRAVAIDLLMFVSFWFVGPAAWRWLCASRKGDHEERVILGYSLYILVSLTVIVLLGWVAPQLAKVGWSFMTDPGSLAVLFVLFTVGGWGLGRDIELEEGLRVEQKRAKQLALEAERAQLLALRAHLDPHFLFNTLNAIAEWCREDPEVAETATLRLADMLRTVLEGVKTEAWTLSKEIELVEGLFELYRVRDPDRYRFTVVHPTPMPDAEVPPMILLPLVENAIKHGPSAGHNGHVGLEIERIDGDKLRLEIRNPGPYVGRREGGEGIAMVERRLALSYKCETELDIAGDDKGEHTTTILSLPTHPSVEKEPQ